MSNRYVASQLNRSLNVACAAVLACFSSLACSDEGHRLGGVMPTLENGKTARPSDRCESGAHFEILDSMEDEDGTIELIEQRAGVWFTFHDPTGGAQLPASDEETFVMTELEPPRARSRYGARTYGKGFVRWGAGIGFELYSQKIYDISRYAGVTFWARREPETASQLRFAVTDSATTPRGKQCKGKECSNHFGAELSLDTTFQRYSFTWDELKQEDNWGFPRPDALNTAEVYGMRFQTGPGAPFDFTIDDVALLCYPE